MNPKIFCIGLNKTGTSSLHEAFQILGLKSVHFRDDKNRNIKDLIETNFFKKKDILSGLDHYDAFSDWEHDETSHLIFKKFDEHYPGSKFILNTRNIDHWLDSRERHVIRNQTSFKKTFIEKNAWLKVEKAYWKKSFERHHQAVESYFKHRPKDLLVFDVTKGDSWEKLCPFLERDIPDIEFPAKNIEPKSLTTVEKSKRLLFQKIKQLL